MRNEELITQKNSGSRYWIAAFAVTLLILVYVFQKFDFSFLTGLIAGESRSWKFIINRLIRFLLNELACLLLIIAIFNNRRYLRIGFTLFIFEFAVLLPVYFVTKLSIEGDSEISSPLLSQFHRIIVNPLLMIALIAGFLYQDKIYRSRA